MGLIMSLLSSTPHEVLGVHIDGQRIQIAHLRRERGRIVLAGLDSATLASRFELGQMEEAQASEPVDSGDILGLTEEPAVEAAEPEPQAEEGEGEDEEPQTNSEVLYRLLDKFPLNRCRLAVSLMETSVFFSDFKDNFGLKEKQLKARLMEEAQKDRTFEGGIPLEDRHSFFETEGGRCFRLYTKIRWRSWTL